MRILWLLALVWSLFAIRSQVTTPFELERMLWPTQREGFATYRSEFPRAEDQIVVVNGGDADQREGVVDQLVKKFGSASAFAVLDVGGVRPTMLYFLSKPQLQDVLSKLIPLHDKLSQRSTLFQWMSMPGVSAAPTKGLAAQLVKHYLTEFEASLQTRGRHRFVSPWLSVLKLPDAFWQLYEGKTRTYLALPPSSHLVMVNESLSEVRAGVNETLSHNPLMTAQISGTDAIVADQARSLGRDVLKLHLMCLIVILVAWALGRPMLPLVLAMLSVGVGLALAMAISMAFLGQAWVVALLAFPLAGAVAACLAFVAAYQPQKRRTVRAGLLVAVAFLPLTVMAFPAASLMSQVLIITAVCSTLALTTLFPRLLPAFPEHPKDHLEVGRCQSSRLCLAILLAAAVLTGVVGSRPVTYQADFVGLLDQQTESFVPEQLMEANGATAITATVLAQNVDQAHWLGERLKSLPSVGNITSVSDYIPPDVQSKQPLVERLSGLLRHIQAPQPIPLEGASDLLALAARLKGKGGPVNQIPEMKRLQKQIESMGPGAIQDGLSGFQTGFLRDLEQMAQLLRDQRATMPALSRIPPELAARMVSRGGHPSITVTPAGPVRSQEALSHFVQDVRSVTPTPAGTAVLLSGLADGFGRAAEWGPKLAWGALACLTLGWLVSLHRTALVVMVPALALFWTRGLMAWLHVPVNPLNWPAQILVLALGVVLCVEATSKTPSRPVVWPHILVMGGFVAVWLSHHPAFHSLGFVGVVGMACNLGAALAVLPALQFASGMLAHKARRLVGLPTLAGPRASLET